MTQTIRMASAVLAACLAGVLIRYWGLVHGVMQAVTDDPLNPLTRSGSVEYLVVVGGFLILLLVSTVGLAAVKRWGIYAAYGLVPVSTIVHGIPLIPFISDLLPSQTSRIAAVFVINVAFAIALITLHISLARTSRRKLDTAPA